MKYKFALRLDAKNPEGKAHIYLNINLKGRIRIALNEFVDPKKWDPIKQRVKGSDPDSEGINAIIEHETQKLLKIKRDAHLKNEQLNFESIYDKYKTHETRSDFLAFMYYHINSGDRKTVLSKETLKHHKVVYNKIKQITNGKINFNSIDYKFFEKFHAFLIRSGANPTTIHNNFKIIITYLNLAKSNGISINENYKRYKIPKPLSRIVYLTDVEIRKLIDYYQRQGIPEDHKNTLQCFLFSASTGGLRYGDIVLINRHNIINGKLVFQPAKTKKINKTISVDLNSVSYLFINEMGPLFNKVYTNQKMNRDLSEVSKICKIDKPISFHVARHSFATNYIKSGAKGERLREILGHEDIKTTMIYVHLAESDQQSAADMLLYGKYILPNKTEKLKIIKLTG